MKIKKSDTVVVISGKDRGKTGKVIRMIPKDLRIVVEGVNIRVKHMRPRRPGQKGQRVHNPAPIAVSTVKAVCPKCGKAARIGYRFEGSKKVRVCKKCGADFV